MTLRKTVNSFNSVFPNSEKFTFITFYLCSQITLTVILVMQALYLQIKYIRSISIYSDWIAYSDWIDLQFMRIGNRFDLKRSNIIDKFDLFESNIFNPFQYIQIESIDHIQYWYVTNGIFGLNRSSIYANWQSIRFE